MIAFVTAWLVTGWVFGLVNQSRQKAVELDGTVWNTRDLSLELGGRAGNGDGKAAGAGLFLTVACLVLWIMWPVHALFADRLNRWLVHMMLRIAKGE